MGHAIAALVEYELRSVVEDPDDGPIFLSELDRSLTERSEALDSRERSLDAREKRLKAQTLAGRADAEPSPTPGRFPKVGRNESCPCGSGVKFKRCHGR